MLHFEFLGLLSESSISSELVRVSNPNTHMPMTRYKIGPVTAVVAKISPKISLWRDLITAAAAATATRSKMNANTKYHRWITLLLLHCCL